MHIANSFPLLGKENNDYSNVPLKYSSSPLSKSSSDAFLIDSQIKEEELEETSEPPLGRLTKFKRQASDAAKERFPRRFSKEGSSPRKKNFHEIGAHLSFSDNVTFGSAEVDKEKTEGSSSRTSPQIIKNAKQKKRKITKESQSLPSIRSKAKKFPSPREFILENHSTVERGEENKKKVTILPEAKPQDDLNKRNKKESNPIYLNLSKINANTEEVATSALPVKPYGLSVKNLSDLNHSMEGTPKATSSCGDSSGRGYNWLNTLSGSRGDSPKGAGSSTSSPHSFRVINQSKCYEVRQKPNFIVPGILERHAILENVHRDRNRLNLEFVPTCHESSSDQELKLRLEKVIVNSLVDQKTELKRAIFLFCRKEIELVIKDKIKRKMLRTNENVFIGELLSIIQKSGLLLATVVPTFDLLLVELETFLSKKKTAWSEELYKTLQHLTTSQFFNFDEESPPNFGMSQFFEIMDKVAALICLKRKSRKLKKAEGLHAPKDAYGEMHPTKEIIWKVFGRSLEEAHQMIHFLKAWSEPGQGGISKAFQVLKRKCKTIVELLEKAEKIPYIEHYCFQRPRYHASFDRISCQDIRRSLKPHHSEVLIENIYINDQKFIPGMKEIDVRASKGKDKEAAVSSLTSPASYSSCEESIQGKEFWESLFDSLIQATKLKDSISGSTAASQFMLYAASTAPGRSSRRPRITPEVYSEIPFMGILQLMTIDSLLIGFKYFYMLFPALYPELDGISSPYFISQKKNSTCRIEIDSAMRYSISLEKGIEIGLKDQPECKVASLILTWLTMPARFNASGQAVEWASTLKIKEYHIFNEEHWEPILSILTDPMDVSARLDLPEGLKFATRFI